MNIVTCLKLFTCAGSLKVPLKTAPKQPCPISSPISMSLRSISKFSFCKDSVPFSCDCKTLVFSFRLSAKYMMAPETARVVNNMTRQTRIVPIRFVLTFGLDIVLSSVSGIRPALQRLECSSSFFKCSA